MLGMTQNQRDDSTVHYETALSLRPTFSDPEIFHVGWSDDSHHGTGTIKPMPTGFRIPRPWFFQADWSQVQHHLFFGESDNGEPLLIYNGWLPNSHAKRHYQIVFYAEKIRELMSSSK